ncbi:MAG: hypothetical protein R3A80_00450 [Bdellovibrionota bacterium]
MTVRAKDHPWSAFLSRDDRVLLKELSSTGWSSHKTLERIPGVVFAALRALHFSRSNRWGVAISVEKMRPLAIQFLEWMRTRGEWDRIHQKWSKKSRGPWSLPFQIFRSYYRFRRSEFPRGVQGEVSYSGQKSLLSMEATLDKALAGPLLEAFSFVTFSLPEPLQLPYQLHLEGLLNNEISILLGKSSDEIDVLILDAKHHLSSGYSKLRESA